jgi:hypothetical protein
LLIDSHLVKSLYTQQQTGKSCKLWAALKEISYCSIVKDIHFREASVFKQHTSSLQKLALANVDELCRSAMQFVNTDPVRDSCSLMIQKSHWSQWHWRIIRLMS